MLERRPSRATPQSELSQSKVWATRPRATLACGALRSPRLRPVLLFSCLSASVAAAQRADAKGRRTATTVAAHPTLAASRLMSATPYVCPSCPMASRILSKKSPGRCRWRSPGVDTVAMAPIHLTVVPKEPFAHDSRSPSAT